MELHGNTQLHIKEWKIICKTKTKMKWKLRFRVGGLEFGTSGSRLGAEILS